MGVIRRSIILIASSLLFLGFGTAYSNAQSVSFATAVNYRTETNPSSVAIGDFNHDGILDLAVANEGDLSLPSTGSVSILLGNGNGSFQPAVSYPVPTPSSVAIGDFNHDGIPDLAAADYDASNPPSPGPWGVSMLPGKGDGTFLWAVISNYTGGTNPQAITVGDFNDDGNLDLAVANSGSNNVGILLGNGDGSFQLMGPYAAGTEPYSVAVGDFNGDGKPDLAIADYQGGVSILLSNGDGTFRTAVTYAAGTNPASVTVGDFNGDGKLDLAVANNGSNNISILLGNGDGTFQKAVNYLAGSAPQSIAVGDLNGDGKLDLAVADNGSGNVSVLCGKGDGTFQAPFDYAAGQGPQSVTVGDLNGDGKPDLAVVDFNGGVSVLLNNTPPEATTTKVTSSLNPAPVGSGVTFTATVAAAGGTPTGTVQFMDGATALGSPVPLSSGEATFTTSSLSAGTHSIHAAYSGDSNFAASDSAPAPVTAGIGPGSIATGDFNGDGIKDVAVANFSSDNVSILLGKGDGTFQPAVNYAAAPDPLYLAVGDFNHDGKQDLAVAEGGGGVDILLGKGDGTFQPAVNYAAGTVNPGSTAVAVGDFNDDGIQDLAVANGYSNTFSILLGKGDGTFQPAVNYAAGSVPGSIVAGDFNHDSKLDLAFSNYNDGNVSVLIGKGDGTFQPAVNYAVGANPWTLIVGDFNRDGISDLAVANEGTNNVSVLMGKGDGTFQPAVNYTAGSFPIPIAAGDFNRDGIADLAVGNSNSNNVSILLGNGDGTFQPAENYAVKQVPHAIAPGDFNHNGNLDLAVANDNSNDISILLGDGTGAFSEPLSQVVVVLPIVSLSAAPTFSGTLVGDTSSPQDVTLTNTGTVALNVTAVSVSGDFAISSNNCTATIAAGASCTVGVTFTPTEGGNRAGTLTFTDNAANSPQTVALSGTGEDFTLAIPSGDSDSVVVNPGEIATYSIAITALGGFNKTVSFKCTGVPAQTDCIIPSSTSLDGFIGGNFFLRLATTRPALLPHGGPRSGPPAPGWFASHAWWIALLMTILLGTLTLASRRRRVPVLAGAVLLAALAMSCGGGGSGGGSTTPLTPGTPPGTYTVTLTGTSGTLSHKVTVHLTVQ